jgi:protein arginine N-methyltransferase 3
MIELYFHFTVPELVASCSDDDNDEAGWEEEEETQDSVCCLFCSESFTSVAEALAHCARDHSFDLTALRTRHHMGTYSYIKLINFVRSHRVSPMELMSCKEPLWDLEIYLKPVMQNDPWLMYGKLCRICPNSC